MYLLSFLLAIIVFGGSKASPSDCIYYKSYNCDTQEGDEYVAGTVHTPNQQFGGCFDHGLKSTNYACIGSAGQYSGIKWHYFEGVSDCSGDPAVSNVPELKPPQCNGQTGWISGEYITQAMIGVCCPGPP
eukprot:92609_1